MMQNNRYDGYYDQSQYGSFSKWMNSDVIRNVLLEEKMKLEKQNEELKKQLLENKLKIDENIEKYKRESEKIMTDQEKLVQSIEEEQIEQLRQSFHSPNKPGLGLANGYTMSYNFFDSVDFSKLTLKDIEEKAKGFKIQKDFNSMNINELKNVLYDTKEPEAVIGKCTINEIKAKLLIKNQYFTYDIISNLPIWKIKAILDVPKPTTTTTTTQAASPPTKPKHPKPINKNTTNAKSDEKKEKEKEKKAHKDDVCKVCLDKPIDCVLVECGHLVSCIDCSKQLKTCPVCRKSIVRVIKTYKS